MLIYSSEVLLSTLILQTMTRKCKLFTDFPQVMKLVGAEPRDFCFELYTLKEKKIRCSVTLKMKVGPEENLKTPI